MHTAIKPSNELIVPVMRASAATCDCPSCGSPLGTNEFSETHDMHPDLHCRRKTVITDCTVCGQHKATFVYHGGRWHIHTRNGARRRKSA